MTKMSLSSKAPERNDFGTHWIGRWPTSTASWMAVGFFVALVLAAVVLAKYGVRERGAAVGLQLTARWSFLLFWFAYAGSAMARLFGARFDALARRGRDFGLAYASAQVVHVSLVLWIFYLAPDKNGGMVFFWVGILCTYLLALFSIPGFREALGPQLWRAYRAAALEYIALAFAADFILGPLQATQAIKYWALRYLPFVLLLIGGVGLRLAARLRGDSRRSRIDASAKMSKLIATSVGLLLLASIAIGLWDLFPGLNRLAAAVALVLIAAGIFNVWGALNSN